MTFPQVKHRKVGSSCCGGSKQVEPQNKNCFLKKPKKHNFFNMFFLFGTQIFSSTCFIQHKTASQDKQITPAPKLVRSVLGQLQTVTTGWHMA